jgi:PAS domain S-box-containing protein
VLGSGFADAGVATWPGWSIVEAKLQQSREPLAVANVAVVSCNAPLRVGDVVCVSALGLPLFEREQRIVASLWLFDTRQRRWAGARLDLLSELCALVDSAAPAEWTRQSAAALARRQFALVRTAADGSVSASGGLTLGRQAALAALGQRALTGEQVAGLVEGALGILRALLPADSAAALEDVMSPGGLRLAAASGWTSLARGDLADAATANALRERLTAGAVLVNDAGSDPIAGDLMGRAAPPLSSAILAMIPGNGQVSRVLLAGTRMPHQFQESDVSFVDAVAAILAGAIAKRATDAELFRSTQLLRALVASSPHAIVAYDETGQVQLWNAAAERIFGHSAASVVGQVDPTIPEDQQEEFKAMCAATRDGRPVQGLEMRRLRQSGEVADLIVSTAVVGTANALENHVLVAMADVTDQRRIEELLRRTQKLEAIGRLASGVAHDFNNLLGVIDGYSGQLITRLHASDPVLEDVQQIQRAVVRAGRLTQHLLAFSKRQGGHTEVLDINESVREMERMLQRVIGEDITLTTELADDLGRTALDRGQLDMLIFNLVLNSRDAMPAGGCLTIRSMNYEQATPRARDGIVVPAGSYVRLSVIDTGVGMDARVVEKIFEPFFSTKSSEGSGLGLATVHGIVKKAGGFILVTSAPSQGTCFDIDFPRATALATAPVAQEANAGVVGGTETILLVEDEELLRTLHAQLLARRGYTVLAASDGREALARAAAHEGPIHLVVTDVVMPGMGAQELARCLAAERPGIRVLFTSGYTAGEVARHGVDESGHNFLAKPVSADALARAVRTRLDSPC